METTRREIIRSARLADAPDHFWITVSIEGDDEREWNFVRKPDGTYWEVVGIDYAAKPPVYLGDQIADPKTLTLCNGYYGQSEKLSHAD